MISEKGELLKYRLQVNINILKCLHIILWWTESFFIKLNSSIKY